MVTGLSNCPGRVWKLYLGMKVTRVGKIELRAGRVRSVALHAEAHYPGPQNCLDLALNTQWGIMSKNQKFPKFQNVPKNISLDEKINYQN